MQTTTIIFERFPNYPQKHRPHQLQTFGSNLPLSKRRNSIRRFFSNHLFEVIQTIYLLDTNEG